jgi:hypothetical protein
VTEVDHLLSKVGAISIDGSIRAIDELENSASMTLVDVLSESKSESKESQDLIHKMDLFLPLEHSHTYKTTVKFSGHVCSFALVSGDIPLKELWKVRKHSQLNDLIYYVTRSLKKTYPTP